MTNKKLLKLQKSFNNYFKTYYSFIFLVYIPVALYFERYFSIVIFFGYSCYIFFGKHTKLEKYLKNKRKNDAVILDHYKDPNEPILRPIYYLTRIGYCFILFNVFCGGWIPLLVKHSSWVFGFSVFIAILDVIATSYIIKTRNPTSDWSHIAFTLGPRVAGVMVPSYTSYANLNPTHPISHPFHLHGPTLIGALGCAPASDQHLKFISHIKTVHGSGVDMMPFCTDSRVPNLSVIKVQIHTNIEEYKKWQARLPIDEWKAYGLDKLFGEGLTEADLLDAKNNAQLSVVLKELELNQQIVPKS